MAKAKEETANTPAVVNQQLEVNGKVLNIEETLSALEGMSEGDLLSNDYWTPEEGEVVKAVFVGMTTINKMNSDTERVEAVQLVMKSDEGRFNRINADKVLVSLCRNLTAPTSLSITCVGKIQGKKGSYREFEVRKLV
jgi:hypothetical protein